MALGARILSVGFALLRDLNPTRAFPHPTENRKTGNFETCVSSRFKHLPHLAEFLVPGVQQIFD